MEAGSRFMHSVFIRKHVAYDCHPGIRFSTTASSYLPRGKLEKRGENICYRKMNGLPLSVKVT